MLPNRSSYLVKWASCYTAVSYTHLTGIFFKRQIFGIAIPIPSVRKKPVFTNRRITPIVHIINNIPNGDVYKRQDIYYNLEDFLGSRLGCTIKLPVGSLYCQVSARTNS